VEGLAEGRDGENPKAGGELLGAGSKPPGYAGHACRPSPPLSFGDHPTVRVHADDFAEQVHQAQGKGARFASHVVRGWRSPSVTIGLDSAENWRQLNTRAHQ
jgi:hypothetical protein